MGENQKKIDERTFDFALLVVDAYRFLLHKKEFVLSKQFLRAGTSIGANVTEAQAALNCSFEFWVLGFELKETS